MLKKLVEYILRNDTKQNSMHSICMALTYNYATVSDYIDHLKATYMIAELRNYDYSLKKQLRIDVKYFCIDSGFVNAVSFLFSENIGRLYENIVFNEFIRRGQGAGLFYLNEGGQGGSPLHTRSAMICMTGIPKGRWPVLSWPAESSTCRKGR